MKAICEALGCSHGGSPSSRQLMVFMLDGSATHGGWCPVRDILAALKPLEASRGRPIWTLLDTVQSMGVKPFESDAASLGVDFICTNFAKHASGIPSTIAGIIGRPGEACGDGRGDALGMIVPIGGGPFTRAGQRFGTVEDDDDLGARLTPGGYFNLPAFRAATTTLTGLMANRDGGQGIYKRAKRLADRLLRGLRRIDGVHLYTPGALDDDTYTTTMMLDIEDPATGGFLDTTYIREQLRAASFHTTTAAPVEIPPFEGPLSGDDPERDPFSGRVRVTRIGIGVEALDPDMDGHVEALVGAIEELARTGALSSSAASGWSSSRRSRKRH